MNKIWVVIKDGVPISAYNQADITPMEIWDKYGVCSVFSVDFVEATETEEMV